MNRLALISASLFVLGLALLFPQTATATDQPGEVGTDEAYIQDRNVDIPNQLLVATIKVKRPGTYYVVVGYTKGRGGKWLRGLFSGADYFRIYTVTLGADDIQTFRMSPGNPPPFGTRHLDIGIYRSTADIQTNR